MERRLVVAGIAAAIGAAAASGRGACAASSEPVLMRITMSDGIVLAVEPRGSGPSLLLVHGASGSRRSWARVAPLLGARFRTFALDKRGYGDSGGAGAYALARLAEDIAAIADRLPPPVFVAAHSSGAIEALEALRRTKAVRGAILYEPPFKAVAGSSADPVCTLVERGDKEAAVLTFLRDYVRLPPPAIAAARASPGWKRQVDDAAGLCHELAALAGYRFDPARFAGVGVPTLFLLGDRSPPVMAASVEAGVAAVPGSALLVLKGQEHSAMFEAPQMVADGITRFIADRALKS